MAFAGVGRLMISASQISRFNHLGFVKITTSIGKDGFRSSFPVGENVTAFYQKSGNRHIVEMANGRQKMELDIYE
jgi:hypothetical protein